MSRTPRWILSGKVYELCFRAREGLPLPPTNVINSIIRGIIARTQRDSKVIICHQIWMSNHVHMIIVVKDSLKCTNFYTELEKKLTDAIKKLLGLEYLNLWQGTPMVSLLPDVDTIIERITYLYANPSEADLVKDIDSYPGISSWKEFNNTDNNQSTLVPWIRLRNMEILPSRSLSYRQDKFLADKFKSKARKFHDLKIEPNAWMKRFNIKKESEVEEINNRIKNNLRQREKFSEERRHKQGKSVVGAHRLQEEAILKPHKPKKKSNKIFVICHDTELRIQCINEHLEFQSLRKQRYLEWKAGDFTSAWPPGAFRPPMPPLANAIECEN